ncbi:MAG: helix-turn-helix transcriptional regulator [Saprospiraceae bacterium]|nr:helix-turn-helix transcriptional regulator [Saprospiraceae bacterium]
MKLSLSTRESEVLSLIVGEYTTNEIADELCVNCETVRTHRKNLLVKLGARNVAGLVRRAFEYNLLPYPLPKAQ